MPWGNGKISKSPGAMTQVIFKYGTKKLNTCHAVVRRGGRRQIEQGLTIFDFRRTIDYDFSNKSKIVNRCSLFLNHKRPPCPRLLRNYGQYLKQYNLKLVLYVLLLGFSTILAACVPKLERPVTAEKALVKLQPSEFPAFSDDMSLNSLQAAINQSLAYLNRLDPRASFRFGPDVFTALHLIDSLKVFSGLIGQFLSEEELSEAIENSFWIYKSIGRSTEPDVLFTGYYEPILRGSLKESKKYPYPIYRRPDDWVSVDLSLFDPKYGSDRIVGRHVDQRVIPYFSREDIDSKGQLDEKGCELVWVSDQMDLFFLQIQGSGQVILEDGAILHVNYDCNNGHAYRSIGKLLIDEGKISREQMSAQRIRLYLKSNPYEIERIFNYNESYVFFRLVDDGPLGAIEVPLTQGRSIATDLDLFPEGALAFVQTEKPVTSSNGMIESWEGFSRFVLNQDTGGAINGPGRVDLFWGNGQYAQIAAGHMQHGGTLYFLVRKDVKK